MPTPEAIEEMRPERLPEEAFSDGPVLAIEERTRQIGRDVFGIGAEDPEEAEREKQRQRASELLAFEEAILKLVDAVGVSLDAKRNAFNFSPRFRLYERRANSWLDIALDSEGQVIRNIGDGDRQMNYTLGLSQGAINTAAPVWKEFMLESGPMPNSVTSRGRSDDSSDAEEMITNVLRHFHEQSHFISRISTGVKDAMSSMLGVIRQRWVQTITVEPDDEGKWVRRISYKGPRYDNWPLPWVWFSHPNRPDVMESKTVLWYSRTNLHELEEEAFVEELGIVNLENEATGEGFQFPFVETAGRYSNLEALRREQSRSGAEAGARTGDNAGRRFSSWIKDERKVDTQANQSNHFNVIGKVDLEGYVPMGSIVEFVTPAVIDEWGWNIPGHEEMSDERLARLLNSIFWDITVTDTGILHYCQPIQYRPARHTALAAAYSAGDGIYGPGIPELGADAEDAIDEMFNDHLFGSKRRNLPNYAMDTTAIMDPEGQTITPDALNRFINGFGEMIQVRNMDVDQAIKSFMPEINPSFVTDMNFLLAQFSEKTMVNDELRGISDNSSATEARQDLAQSIGRGIDRAKNFARLVVERGDRNLLADISTFVDNDEFRQLVIAVAGEAGMKAHYVFPSVENVASQFNVRHSGQPLVNREVKVAQMNQVYDRYAPTGELNIKASLSYELGLLEVGDIEQFLTNSSGNRDPKLEIKMFANDKYLEPNEDEDSATHYRVHIDQLLAIAPKLAASILDPEVMFYFLPKDQQGNTQFSGSLVAPGLETMRFQPEVVTPQLVEHLTVTQQRLKEVIAEQLAAAEAAALEEEESIDAEFEESEPAVLGGGASVDVEATNGPRIVDGIKRAAMGLPKGLSGGA